MAIAPTWTRKARFLLKAVGVFGLIACIDLPQTLAEQSVDLGTIEESTLNECADRLQGSSSEYSAASARIRSLTEAQKVALILRSGFTNILKVKLLDSIGFLHSENYLEETDPDSARPIGGRWMYTRQEGDFLRNALILASIDNPDHEGIPSADSIPPFARSRGRREAIELMRSDSSNFLSEETRSTIIGFLDRTLPFSEPPYRDSLAYADPFLSLVLLEQQPK